MYCVAATTAPLLKADNLQNSAQLTEILKWCRYRMDYLKFVEHHRSTNADITIGCLPVDYERASDFGLMKIDEEGRIYVGGLSAAYLEASAVACSFYWPHAGATHAEVHGVLCAGLCREAQG